jgi:hypothetical protein
VKPIDLRNATWSILQAGLNARLQDVYRIWCQHGPGTTRSVAIRSGCDILSLRPRTTDLYHLGMVELTGRTGNEGIYQARRQSDWELWVVGAVHPSQPGQPQLL